MAKEKEEIAGIIRKADYIEELEAQVRLEVARVLAENSRDICTNPLPYKKKYEYTEIPDFSKLDKREIFDYQMREIQRCKEGYQGIPGKYYYYLNHTRIKHKSRGKIRPDFRNTDLHWFKFLEKMEAQQGKGIVCIKRRQVGMSWKAAVDAVYSCQFNRDYEIGMNSKGERDSWDLLAKVKYLYRNQSDFLRIRTSTDRRDALDFAVYDKDEQGNRGRLVAGTESKILCVSPAPTAHAGRQYKKLIIDEAGEQEGLMALWSNAEDCLMQETVRVGTPIIFGTMGETGTFGAGLQEFWNQHELYDLERFAFWGYNELIMDEFHNDDIPESIRWIIYTRKKKEAGSTKVYNKFKQKYPLNSKDAFLVISGSGVGDPIKIGNQLDKLSGNPAFQVHGWFKADSNGSPKWVPDPNGKVIIYEHPKPLVNGYVAAADPADHEDVEKSRDSSNLALAIMSRPFQTEPPKLVLEYVDRPKRLDEWFAQSVMALKYYNNTKVLPEDNRARMLKYYLDNGHENLLALTPKGVNSVGGGVQFKYGIKMTAERKLQMMGLLDDLVDNYCDFIPSVRLLNEMLVFGGDHDDDDLAVAVGFCMMMLQADKSTIRSREELSKNIPNLSYQKIGKTINLVSNGSIVRGGGGGKFRSKSALFKF